MDTAPLVNEEIDAAATFAREFDRYAPVSVAFWLRKSDEANRYFYIASDRIDGNTLDVGYGEVLRLAGELRSPWFDVFLVNLIGIDDPLARAALELRTRLAGRPSFRFEGGLFGGVSAEEVYVFPPILNEAVA